MSGGAFVSRAGRKLDHALEAFDVSVDGLDCADFGCNVGGFTDCLLRRGARRVYAVDTGYGVLAYALRRDERVVAMERTNALHAEPPEGKVDLVTIDLAWTRQRVAIPAALGWLRRGGRLITLVKPHYETQDDGGPERLVRGTLEPQEAARVFERVRGSLAGLGAKPLAHVLSPITGGKSTRAGRGNVEYLLLAEPAEAIDQLIN